MANTHYYFRATYFWNKCIKFYMCVILKILIFDKESKKISDPKNSVNLFDLYN